MSKVFNIVLHLSYWVGFIFFLRASPMGWGWTISKNFDTLWPHSYGAVTNAIIFYSTCFYLIPRYFNVKLKFYGYAALGLISISLLELLLDYNFALPRYQEDYLSFNKWEVVDAVLNQFLIYILPINLIYFLLAFGYRFPIDKKIQEEKEQQLVQEKLNAELKFLKAQIDPHTLFNGMNTIYHLIAKDGDKAQEVVLKFSNLLRYQLYDCDEELIPIGKEINYLNNYIELNKVRVEADAIVEVDLFSEEEETLIPPLLFTPFIENAFKYLSNNDAREENRISIQLLEEDGRICFKITNTIDIQQKEGWEEKGGIGITNAVNRLNLLYGNNYTLNYGLKGTYYEVDLVLLLGDSKPN